MDVKYVTQKNVLIANYLSCLIDVKTCKDDSTLDMQIADLGIHGDIKVDWRTIRQQTIQDETLIKLATVIQKGLEESQSELPDDVKPYYPYRFTLYIVDGIVAMDGHIVVPSDLRSQFLDKIHEPHLGIVKSKCLAKSLVHWPGYSSDVKMICKQCEQCRENQIMLQTVPKFHIQVNEPEKYMGATLWKSKVTNT